MKKVVSILLAMIILCSLFTGCATNTPNNSTSDTSPAGNSATTNDTKTYRMALIYHSVCPEVCGCKRN